MTVTIGFDTRELRQYSVDLGDISRDAVAQIEPIVNKGALNVKKDIQAEFFKSPSFGHIGHTVSYDITVSQAGIFAEIGPEKRYGKGSKGGNLANIAIFGSYKGGATVSDPLHALLKEIPMFEEQLVKKLADML